MKVRRDHSEETTPSATRRGRRTPSTLRRKNVARTQRLVDRCGEEREQTGRTLHVLGHTKSSRPTSKAYGKPKHYAPTRTRSDAYQQ